MIKISKHIDLIVQIYFFNLTLKHMFISYNIIFLGTPLLIKQVVKAGLDGVLSNLVGKMVSLSTAEVLELDDL